MNLAVVTCFAFWIHASFAFTPLNLKSGSIRPSTTTTSQLYSSSSISSKKNGNVTGKVQQALKKMRGTSISVGYTSPITDNEPSSMDMELLSQALRKSKSASIWTSDLKTLNQFSKEQESAMGNFPGPVPVIYTGSSGDGGLQSAIENGADGIVMDVGGILDCNDDFSVDVICQVENVDDIRKAIDAGYGYAFLLSGNKLFPDGSIDDVGTTSLVEALDVIPKEAVVIVSLDAMQPDSQEISTSKQMATFKSETTGSKVHAILIENACVGDAEDVKYTQFVVDEISKKSSSSFSMTGLTGSTNGHFGTSSDSSNAKWNRIERQK